MKCASLLLAFFISAPSCHAQDAAPANPPATQENVNPTFPAVVRETAKPFVPAAVKPVDGSYVIGASDVITVTVLKEPTLSSSLLVRPDGMITMPLLGDVKASGLTPLQLADGIAIRLMKYIQDPNVSVILTQINSRKVYLIGEVTKTGAVDITPGMTLLEAIASAGGLTQYANSKKMYILRSEDGKHSKVPVRYKDALKGNSALNLTLKSGDTIVVP
jgi:polysaccharide biosynthesis/export protein